ncbi:MAG TPA: hypothetical protein VE398_25285 [Acidobacteriota bacterium]|nr:hypothetical protein [Acidobacteriota bacterium]
MQGLEIAGFLTLLLGGNGRVREKVVAGMELRATPALPPWPVFASQELHQSLEAT